MSSGDPARQRTCYIRSNTLGSCNAACGRYRRGLQNGSLGRGAGHPSAELSLGSRGVMNRRTLAETKWAQRIRNPTDIARSRAHGSLPRRVQVRIAWPEPIADAED